MIKQIFCAFQNINNFFIAIKRSYGSNIIHIASLKCPCDYKLKIGLIINFIKINIPKNLPLQAWFYDFHLAKY